MTAPERWLPVAGYEGQYEVSDRGNVRSMDRITVDSIGRPQPRVGRPMRPFVNSYGYLSVKLCKGSKSSPQRIHVLVATAFVPRPDGTTQVRHLDGDQTNNWATNLLWGTQRENEIDKRAHGTALPTWSPHTHCCRGHLLDGPNLIREGDGRRRCLACRRARSDVRDARVRRGVVLDMGARAAWHYQQITRGEAA